MMIIMIITIVSSSLSSKQRDANPNNSLIRERCCKRYVDVSFLTKELSSGLGSLCLLLTPPHPRPPPHPPRPAPPPQPASPGRRKFGVEGKRLETNGLKPNLSQSCKTVSIRPQG